MNRKLRRLGTLHEATRNRLCRPQRGVRYAGHGTSPQDLARTSWRDWVASAEEAGTELRGRCTQVRSIGLSLGGLISLHLAERH